MQVVINKEVFLLPPPLEKNLVQIRRFVFKKKTHTLIPKNDVTEPKARLL